MKNFYAFYTKLVNEFEDTFNRSFSSTHRLREDRPERTAYRAIGLIDAGWSIVHSPQIRSVCQHFGIRNTLKGIREFWLDKPTDVAEVKP